MVGALRQGIADAACDPKATWAVGTAGFAPKAAALAEFYPSAWVPLADVAAICTMVFVVTSTVIRIRREWRDTQDYSRRGKDA